MSITVNQNGAAWFVRIDGELAGGFHKKEYAELFVAAFKAGQ